MILPVNPELDCHRKDGFSSLKKTYDITNSNRKKNTDKRFAGKAPICKIRRAYPAGPSVQ